MRVWRLARAPYRALDGEGARLAGGRWNSVGIPVVYSSSHLSLAALEILVHAADPAILPVDFVAIAIDLADSLIGKGIDMTEFPIHWRSTLNCVECRSLGDRWANDLTVLALPVPSAVIPSETNILINPRHPAMASGAVIADEMPFEFDRRLLRR
jgi:RES domain-containing protein